jgi:hypothetical protein
LDALDDVHVPRCRAVDHLMTTKESNAASLISPLYVADEGSIFRSRTSSTNAVDLRDLLKECKEVTYHW